MTPRLKTFLVAALFLLLAAALAAWGLWRLDGGDAEILSSNVGSIHAAEELAARLHDLRDRLDRLLLAGDRGALEGRPEVRGEAGRWLAEADRLGTTEREQVLMRRVKDGFLRLSSFLDECLPALPADARPARDRIDGLIAEEILAPLHEYAEWNEELAARGVEDNRRTAGCTVLGLLALGVCGPALGLVRAGRAGRQSGRDVDGRSELDSDAAALLRHVSQGMVVVGDNAPRLASSLGMQTGALLRAVDLLAALGLVSESLVGAGMRRLVVTDAGVAYLLAREQFGPTKRPWRKAR